MRWADGFRGGGVACGIKGGGRLDLGAIVADAPVARNDVPDAVDRSEQIEREAIIGERIGSLVIEQRDLDVRAHVTGEQRVLGRDVQRGVAWCMCAMLDHPHLGAIPLDRCRTGRKRRELAEQRSVVPWSGFVGKLHASLVVRG